MIRHRERKPLLSAEESAVLLGREFVGAAPGMCVDAYDRVPRSAERGTRSQAEQRRMTLSLPLWMVEGLEKQAQSQGISTEALIRFLLAGQLGGHLERRAGED